MSDPFDIETWTFEAMAASVASDDGPFADVAFDGAIWTPDPSVTDGPIPGHRYDGEGPAIICNDVFFWGCADSEDIFPSDWPAFVQAVKDCGGSLSIGADLWCARKRGQRPQGAVYSFIPEQFWHLFDACGPGREKGPGNPCAPGEYSIQGGKR